MELSENEKEAIKRCEYACELLRKNNIPHVVKKKEIGHINLLAYVNGKIELKAVMSFWARTGKFIFLRCPSSKTTIVTENDRGIKNCIAAYKEFVRLENEK